MLPFLLTLAQAFLTEPYLQLGERPAPDRLTIAWQAPDVEAEWWLEHKKLNAWVAAARITNRRVRLNGTKPFRIYEAELDRLSPGAEFDYRVTRNNQTVFESRAKAIPPESQATRFALIADTGQGTRGQRQVAEQIQKAQPDALLVAGDIVYPSGRLKHYAERWFPIMSPLLRSRVSAATPGNHDIEECHHLDAKPDCLAYFHIWSQPLNGPTNTSIPVRGPTAAFKEATGAKFPRAANYSFDYGPVHWTMLDSNHYMDWTRPDLIEWLERDLAAARRPWRVVMLHHAPFHSTRKHAEQQRMRVLAPIFEKHGVRIVFAGHVHNYQRSHPIRFTPSGATHPLGALQRIRGKVERDEQNGVIYIVTGAGGAGLHDPGSSANPQAWQAFTAKFEARQHSFTQVDATGTNMAIRQIGADGRELDSFSVARR